MIRTSAFEVEDIVYFLCKDFLYYDIFNETSHFSMKYQ